MRQIASLVLVLTALCALSAFGSPAHSAKVHKKAVPAASEHSKSSQGEEKAADTRAGANRKGVQGRHSSRTAVRDTDPAAHSADSAARAPEAQTRYGRRSRRSQFAAESAPEVADDSRRRPRLRQAALLRTRLLPGSPLLGTHESLVRQNVKTEADGLERIEDDNDLNDRIARQMLVPVPASSMLTVNESQPLNRRYCRPWTAAFLSDLARVHAAQFHHPIYVSSAVRTVAFQKQLIQINGNAASAEGDVASPHLTGATIDIAKQGMNGKELAWMRAWLLPLQRDEKIDVEEEFRQSCFHITVYKEYAPDAAEPRVGAPVEAEQAHSAKTIMPAPEQVASAPQAKVKQALQLQGATAATAQPAPASCAPAAKIAGHKRRPHTPAVATEAAPAAPARGKAHGRVRTSQASAERPARRASGRAKTHRDRK